MSKVLPRQDRLIRPVSEEECDVERGKSSFFRKIKPIFLFSKLDFSSPATGDCQSSEVCSVSGAIIATIGALTAVMGVFPGNQAQIRLYLECLGCSMVILGTLVIFLSQKMRAKALRRVHNRRHLIWQQFNCNMQQEKSPTNPSPVEQSHSTWCSENASPVAATNTTTGSFMFDEQHHTSKSLVPLVQTGISHWPALDPSWGPKSSTNVEDFDEADEATNDEDGAVVEAALSIVLSAATIAGFRSSSIHHQDVGGGGDTFTEEQRRIANELIVTCSPGSIGYHHGNLGNVSMEQDCNCCLHHAVQHKLSARKWIKRLDNSKHVDSV